jgi:glycerophosphoryl diester phosphodiesterase
MMKLKCVDHYRAIIQHVPHVYLPGDIIDGPIWLVEFLRRDAPACFTVALDAEEPETRATEEPPADRMLTDAPNRAVKGRRRA